MGWENSAPGSTVKSKYDVGVKVRMSDFTPIDSPAITKDANASLDTSFWCGIKVHSIYSIDSKMEDRPVNAKATF